MMDYIDLIVLFGLLSLGFVFGRLAERRHFKSINEREREFIDLVTTSSKRPVGPLANVINAHLVTGSAVISVDYFKRLVAGLRNIFGGNVQSYETLVDRARREAVLRLKQSCSDATQIINLRIETSSITKGKKGQIGSVEVFAYATAIYCGRPS